MEERRVSFNSIQSTTDLTDDNSYSSTGSGHRRSSSGTNLKVRRTMSMAELAANELVRQVPSSKGMLQSQASGEHSPAVTGSGGDGKIKSRITPDDDNNNNIE
jgi:hypothetical protein